PLDDDLELALQFAVAHARLFDAQDRQRGHAQLEEILLGLLLEVEAAVLELDDQGADFLGQLRLVLRLRRERHRPRECQGEGDPGHRPGCYRFLKVRTILRDLRSTFWRFSTDSVMYASSMNWRYFRIFPAILCSVWIVIGSLMYPSGASFDFSQFVKDEPGLIFRPWATWHCAWKSTYTESTHSVRSSPSSTSSE